VEDAADVLVELAPQLEAEGVELAPEAPADDSDGAPVTSDPSYDRLLKELSFSPTPIGDLSTRTGLTTAELSSMLLLLELEGQVEALPGGRYSRRRKKN